MLGNINKIKQYIVEVKNISPLRIGNGEDEGSGLLLYDNHAIINGTTLSGLFRDFFKKGIEKGKKKEYEGMYKLVFPENDDDKKEISKIYFYDSISNEKIKDKDLCCRNHVKIDEKWGCSTENHLFDEYHVSEGKTFRLFFEVRGLELEQNKYKNLCDYLERFITEIINGEITIGSKSTFGFGRFSSIEDNKLYYKEYDLLQKDDLDNYLNFNVNSLSLKSAEFINIKKRGCSRIKVSLQAYCDDGFIIKGQQGLDEEKNVFDKSYQEYINEKDTYIIPSSTIKGIIKNYCNKIYETLDKDKEDIENMFGKKSDNKDEGKKGKLIFEDCKINEGKIQPYNRTKIDRFTGGVMTGSLFREDVVIISKDNPIEFNVFLNEEDKRALALIILTFRDIGLGYLTVGSGNNVGYGRFKGKSITIDGADYNNIKIDFQDGKLIGNIDKVNSIINILKE